MSKYWCTRCNQFYSEAGFCPFDGTALTVPPTEVAQPPTMRAMSASEGGTAALAAFTPRHDYDHLIGQTLDGRYHIERKIGEGGMGVVFAARHAVIEKPLAIKVLKREVARDAATVKRFVQEAKAASRIGHPAIVDVTDFGTTPEGMTYSVMEYVDGSTLSSVIKRSAPLTLERALPIVAQIARALGAAHDKGIVHRDLKPENVFLVNRDGRRDFVKIVDFGIAKVTPVEGQPTDGPRLTRAGSVFGTPEYMAPEQAAGRSDTDQRVDIYALATILYEMLVGRVPHKSESMVRTLAMQMLDPIEPPTKVRPELTLSAEFERVLMKGLAKKREQRYASMADFLADLERACPGINTAIPAASDQLHLVAAPPGADMALLSSQKTLDDVGPIAAGPDAPTRRPGAPSSPPPTTGAPGEAPRATSRKVAHEPAFVTSQGKVTFEHVFDPTDEPPRRRSRAPVIAIAVLLAAGGGVAAAVLMRGDEPRTAARAVDAGAADAAVPVVVDGGVTTPPRDAEVIAEVPRDAGLPIDAGPRAPRDAGPGRRVDAGVRVPPERLTARGELTVQVITYPDGGTIYAGDSYRGPAGTTIEEPVGTRLKIKCTLAGHDPGYVDLVFDAKLPEVVSCRPTRPKRCIEGLHNPFDDCPDPAPPE